MKRIVAYLVYLCIALSAMTQPPVIEWENTIGGNAVDWPDKVVPTTDGGYIVGGHSESGISGDKTEANAGYRDFWIIKLFADGSINWQNTIGGTGEEYLYDIIQTSDGGYFIGGTIQADLGGSLGPQDFYMVKLDPQGNLEWDKTIGGNEIDVLKAVDQTTDGGYILGGDSYSGISGDKTEASQGGNDYWIVKIDSTGNILWQNAIGGAANDHMSAITQTSDGGFILGGFSYSGISGDKTEGNEGNSDYWIVKLDGSGNISWQNNIGASDRDFLTSTIQTNDNGYFVGGYSMSGISGDKTETNRGSNDYWALKLDNSGAIQWQITLGGADSDVLGSVDQTQDNGYILGGHSDSDISGDKTLASKGNFDHWLVKLDNTGNVTWQKVIGGSDKDFHRSISQTSDQGYVLASNSISPQSGDKSENSLGDYDYWIIKLQDTTMLLPLIWGDIGANRFNRRIEIFWSTLHEKNVSHFEIERSSESIGFHSIGETSAQNQYEGGSYNFFDENPHPGNNFYRIKQVDFSGRYTYSKVVQVKYAGLHRLSIYPNPARNYLRISLPQESKKVSIQIHNNSGQLIKRIPNPDNEIIDLAGLMPGIYYLQLKTNSEIIIEKLIIK